MELSLTASSLLLFLLLCLLPLVYLFYLQVQDPKTQRGENHVLKAYPIVDTIPHFIKNRHRFLEWSAGVLQRSPTHTMSFKVLGRPGGVFTANPANLEHMVKTNFENYPKGEFVDMLDDFLGHGIFNSDGVEWVQQRKTASYEFNKRSLRNFVVHAVHFEAVERLLPLLERAAAAGRQTLDMLDVLEGFAFDNICRVAFDDDPACLTEEGLGGSNQSKEVMHAFKVATKTIMIRFVSPSWLWRLLRLLDLGPERKMRKAIAVIHGYANKIIQKRRESGEILGPSSAACKDDLLSRFAATGEHTDEGLLYVVTNFILAGRDATSSSLAWLLWLVSSRPEVEDKILAEIRAVRAATASGGGGDADPTTFSFDELREMHYLHAAIAESMRLYPPIPINTRISAGDDLLPDGTFVGKGWQMTYCPYAMARLEDLWGKDCEVFRPERWLDEAGAFRPEAPCKYPVFHAGPRMCLGKEMAYIQMKSIVASVYERFILRYVGGEGHPGLQLAGTLRMRGGLPMQIIPRPRVAPAGA
jgi:cytochrome P450